MEIEENSDYQDSEYIPRADNKMLVEDDSKEHLNISNNRKSMINSRNGVQRDINKFEPEESSQRKIKDRKRYVSLSKKMELPNIDFMNGRPQEKDKDAYRSVSHRSKPKAPQAKNQAIRKTNNNKMKEFSYVEKIAEQRKKQANKEKSGDKFVDALSCLQESWLPKQLLCRDSEKETIRDFILEGIENKGQAQSLYISGVPGLGKTACLMEVIRELQEKKTEFSFHYLNGLKLQKPENLYSKLVHE